ncbi:unnamed protein product, partial [Heterosigma akashiwo]
MPDLGAVYLWPLFAAGQVYASSSLTTLATQAVFRPSVVRILEELLALPRPAPSARQDAAAAARPPRRGTTRVAGLVGQEGDGSVGLEILREPIIRRLPEESNTSLESLHYTQDE